MEQRFMVGDTTVVLTDAGKFSCTCRLWRVADTCAHVLAVQQRLHLAAHPKVAEAAPLPPPKVARVDPVQFGKRKIRDG